MPNQAANGIRLALDGTGGWRPIGRDPRFVVGRMPPAFRRRTLVSLAGSGFGLMFTCFWFVVLYPSVPPEPVALATAARTGTAWAMSAIALLFALSVVWWYRQLWCRVECDPFGITIRNRWRTHRIRWSDIDAVVLDGRPAVTVLAATAVVECHAFSVRIAGGHSMSRAGEGGPIDAAADYLEEARRFYASGR